MQPAGNGAGSWIQKGWVGVDQGMCSESSGDGDGQGLSLLSARGIGGEPAT